MTTNNGQRFLLGAPVSSPVMRGRMFLNKYDQIISYWGHAVEGLSRPEDAASGSLTTGLGKGDCQYEVGCGASARADRRQVGHPENRTGAAPYLPEVAGLPRRCP